jgi:glycine betaine/choline ABC-type transport system substrate-binding protein
MASPRALAAPAALLACLALASCGGGDGSTASGGAPISRGAGTRNVAVTMAYTRSPEQQLLAQIYTQALRAAGFKVRLARGVTAGGPGVAALEEGRFNAYPRFARVLAPERRHLSARGVTPLPPGPPVRSDGLATLARTARKYKLEEVSGLSDRAAHWTLAVPRGCQRQPDCLPALERAYGLDFRRVHPVRPELVHEALRTGRAQVSLVTTTDPHIRRSGEALLEDDRRAFPAGGPVMLVRTALARRAGRALRSAVDKADSGLTVEVVQELNARVQFDDEPPVRVAGDYLRATGLLSPG